MINHTALPGLPSTAVPPGGPQLREQPPGQRGPCSCIIAKREVLICSAVFNAILSACMLGFGVKYEVPVAYFASPVPAFLTVLFTLGLVFFPELPRGREAPTVLEVPSAQPPVRVDSLRQRASGPSATSGRSVGEGRATSGALRPRVVTIQDGPPEQAPPGADSLRQIASPPSATSERPDHVIVPVPLLSAGYEDPDLLPGQVEGSR